MPLSQTPYLDAGRNGAAVILFMIWPVAQVFIPRSTPLFLALAVVSVLVCSLISRRRGELEVTTSRAFSLQLTKSIFLPIFLFLSLVGISLLWSPIPERGAKDIGVLIAGLLAAVFLARELPKVTFVPIINFVLVALIIISFTLILESWQLTSLHKTFLDTNFIYDLNRSAAWLLLTGCAVLGFVDTRKTSRADALTIGALVVFAIFSSEGEAAKLGLLGAALAALITHFFPPLVKPLFMALAAVVLTMPLLVNTLTHSDGKPRIAVPAGAHASHRIALWQGYAELIKQKPILGWGAKADRALGKSGEAAKIAADRGYPDKTTSPHNAALEIWTNQGFAGAAIAAIVLLVAGWRISKLPNWPRISAVTLMIAIFTVSMTGSSFYQSWWIASIATGFVIWGSAVRSTE